MRLQIERDTLRDKDIQEVLLQNDFLREQSIALIKLLKEHGISTHKLNYGHKQELSIRARRLNHQSRKKYISIAAPRTVLYAWFKKETNKIYDSSDKQPEKKKVGQPAISPKFKQIIIQMAKDNPRWGYQTISDVVKLLHIKCSASSVRNILNAVGIYPAPERDKSQTWHEFMKTTGMYQTDFFTQHALVKCELENVYYIVCYYVLFYINVGTRKVTLGGITTSPNADWMNQMARNINWDIADMKYLVMDGDKKFCLSFKEILKSEGIKPIRLPPRSPNLNAFAERWVKTVKTTCLDHILIRGDKHLRHVMKEFIDHYNHERPHQSLDGRPPDPYPRYKGIRSGKVVKTSRLNGLLNSYYLSCA
jgi:putative transposase